MPRNNNYAAKVYAAGAMTVLALGNVKYTNTTNQQLTNVQHRLWDSSAQQTDGRTEHVVSVVIVVLSVCYLHNIKFVPQPRDRDRERERAAYPREKAATPCLCR